MNNNPQRVTVQIRGNRASGWRTKSPGDPAYGGAGVKRKGGRPDDGLPKPQAFSLPFIRTYPARTATCRQCESLELHSCARGCCAQLPRGHSFLINAIADGECPLGKFDQEL